MNKSVADNWKHNMLIVLSETEKSNWEMGSNTIQLSISSSEFNVTSLNDKNRCVPRFEKVGKIGKEATKMIRK